MLVTISVQDVQRFPNILKNFENIIELDLRSSQPQDLFDRLSTVPFRCSTFRFSLSNQT